MTKLFLRLILIIAIFSSCQNKAISDKDTSQISIATKHVISSEILKENKDILISLPDGYEKTNATYPILVLTDGKQNIKHAIALTDKWELKKRVWDALKSPIFYKPVGCDICEGDGYKWRVGLYEVLEITPGVKEMILSGQSA